MAYLPIQAHSIPSALSINIIQLYAIIQKCHSFSKLLAFIYIILFPKSLISPLLSLNYLLSFGFCIYLLGKPEQLNSPTHPINSHGTLWFVRIHILSYLLQFWLNLLYIVRDYSFFSVSNQFLSQWMVVGCINDSAFNYLCGLEWVRQSLSRNL